MIGIGIRRNSGETHETFVDVQKKETTRRFVAVSETTTLEQAESHARAFALRMASKVHPKLANEEPELLMLAVDSAPINYLAHL